ncbi:restriction endonuclease [Natrinema sp. LN54]|uniref:restriction endonuclease n=1 Tax=Natrinema sp. LN54 TaxID=3458705 RepID=UPI004035B143
MSKGLRRGKLLHRLREIDPYTFQELVAELWQLQGYEAEVLRDESVHILARRDESALGQGVAVQTRRLSEGYKVDSTDIAQFIDARRHEDVESVVVVTTTEFTEDAIDRANREGMKLVNGEELVELIHDLEAEELLEEYSNQENAVESTSDIPAKDTLIQVVAATGAWVLTFLAVAVFPIFYPEYESLLLTIGVSGGLLAWFAIPITIYRDVRKITQETGNQGSPFGLAVLGFLGAGLASTYYLRRRFKNS